ncbi:cytochrome P450 [Mycobacterium sp. 94-17]|uniref:cytochrome P450 n=1 Tax=Mycobacterium sp. 94-17 TaxID=2986147 RepID=UPI002D1F4DF8|nr:cytochrome P450 [Mycobacterium sp. 94-17]MEB4209758.1 cytochrome P450 [Mycobacterium sp. 94-17]
MTTSQTTVRPRYEVDLDHHGQRFRDERPEVFKELFATGREMVWSRVNGGYWMAFGYDAVYEIAHDTDLFSSAWGPRKGVPQVATVAPLIPLDYDPPQVGEYRKLTLPALSPGQAKKSTDSLEATAHELVDKFIESGKADLIEDLATPLPAIMILRKLGWDESRWPEWIEWTHTTMHDRMADPDKTYRAFMKMNEQIGVELAKRREKRTDDLTSHMMYTETETGRLLTDDELGNYATLLLLGGMDTTSGLTGSAFVHLAQNPQLRQQLIDHPERLPDAVEEFLRHDSPLMGLFRHVTRDTVFRGEQLREGDRIVLFFPAAGWDPNRFPEPEDVRLDRGANRHFAFGVGTHRCLGSNYARVLNEIMLKVVLERLPDYRMLGPVDRFEDGGDIYAVRSLPVEFTSGPKIAAGP